MNGRKHQKVTLRNGVHDTEVSVMPRDNGTLSGRTYRRAWRALCPSYAATRKPGDCCLGMHQDPTVVIAPTDGNYFDCDWLVLAVSSKSRKAAVFSALGRAAMFTASLSIAVALSLSQMILAAVFSKATFAIIAFSVALAYFINTFRAQ